MRLKQDVDEVIAHAMHLLCEGWHVRYLFILIFYLHGVKALVQYIVFGLWFNVFIAEYYSEHFHLFSDYPDSFLVSFHLLSESIGMLSYSTILSN